MIGRAARIAATALGVALAPPAGAREGAPALECFSLAQTRNEIEQHHLVKPLLLMQKIQRESRTTQGDALSMRLCRSGEQFVYEITFLGRDWRVKKLFFEALSGEPHYVHPDH